ncbi:MmyB family transcriptional regulator [Streptomyces europaeiscabiei]|uniref:MmyB family transcriptional regulator n=1 Tax=Streptomyces europaeiscabiei TaxID=146819 RepID=UPI0038D4B2CD
MLDDLTASHASVTGRRTDILGWNQLAAALFRQSVNRPEGSWSPVPWAMLTPAWTAPRERSSWWSSSDRLRESAAGRRSTSGRSVRWRWGLPPLCPYLTLLRRSGPVGPARRRRRGAGAPRWPVPPGTTWRPGV